MNNKEYIIRYRHMDCDWVSQVFAASEAEARVKFDAALAGLTNVTVTEIKERYT